MYIRRVAHKDSKNRRKYDTFKLVESIRTERGPRQRVVLNLGSHFELPRDQWKELANCIEEILTGQGSLVDYSKEVKTFASKYARKVIGRHGDVVDEGEEAPVDYATVDVNSLENEEPRCVGAEHVVYETIKDLQIERKLRELGLSTGQVAASVGLIAGRMIAPGSERAAHYWLQHISALNELMGVDFSDLSLDRVYKVSDELLKRKRALEKHLRLREGQLFGLEEKIILYDLTNTFFEGSGKFNSKARFGRSKDKRTDCPLVTLGLVLDINGFAKTSRMFEGNISEPKTLERMIRRLSGRSLSQNPFLNPTVVLDAGIASEKNILWLKDHHYSYIVVSRRKKPLPPGLKMIAVKKEAKTNAVLVQAGLVEDLQTGESELYCHSIDKEKKEEGIQNRFQERFECELQKARNALHLKNGTKRYDKVIERIGRLKERYKRVSRGYEITIQKDAQSPHAKEITWSRRRRQKQSGVYCLRTNRKDLDERKIWDIYTMLTDIEDAFRCMKSELGLRPIYHQKEERCEGHIFITLLAYHVLHTIRFKLRQKGIRLSWSTIRRRLSTQLRVTTAMKRRDGRIIRIRKSTRAELAHREIYDALNLPCQPGKAVKSIL